MFSTSSSFIPPLLLFRARNTCHSSLKRETTSCKIKIFDTTLRDGELNTGVSFSHDDKLRIAHQLCTLGVDVIEAGFPALYSSDIESLEQICRQVGNLSGSPSICALARANRNDIQVGFESIQHALYPRIHTFLTTSRPQTASLWENYGNKLLRMTESAVRYAKSVCSDVEFSAADAFRTDRNLLIEIVECAIQSGATTISIPDTHGTALPSEVSSLFSFIRQHAKRVNGITLSMHAHNDLGLAVANSLSAIQSGATQVEVSVNGIGARAGNASLEEVVRALFVRRKAFRDAFRDASNDTFSGDEEQFVGELTNVRRHHLAETCRMVAKHSGINVQPNKAIADANARSSIDVHGT